MAVRNSATRHSTVPVLDPTPLHLAMPSPYFTWLCLHCAIRRSAVTKQCLTLQCAAGHRPYVTPQHETMHRLHATQLRPANTPHYITPLCLYVTAQYETQPRLHGALRGTTPHCLYLTTRCLHRTELDPASPELYRTGLNRTSPALNDTPPSLDLASQYSALPARNPTLLSFALPSPDNTALRHHDT